MCTHLNIVYVLCTLTIRYLYHIKVKTNQLDDQNNDVYANTILCCTNLTRCSIEKINWQWRYNLKKKLKKYKIHNVKKVICLM